MRRRTKPAGLPKKKRALLAACVAAALFCGTPAYAYGPFLDHEGEPDLKNAGGAPLTIGAGQTLTTWGGGAQDDYFYDYVTGYFSAPLYTNVTLEEGAVWRPMDMYDIFIQGTLTLKKDSVLDLSYKYGENYPANPWTGQQSWPDVATVRMLDTRAFSTGTVFHDGAILRLNVGNVDTTNTFGLAYKDQFWFKNPTLGDDTVTVRVQTRYNRNFGGAAWEAAQVQSLTGREYSAVVLLGITDTVKDKIASGDFKFVGETSYIDDTLHKYALTAEITPSGISGSAGNYSQYYNIDWTAELTEFDSQGVFTASNAQLAMRNLWRIEDGLSWKRGEDLRAAARLGRSEGADGAWAQVWRGKYSFDGVIGSRFGQSYNGLQLGYDKQREGDFYGGRLYTGLFVSLLDSDAAFHNHRLDSGSGAVNYNHASGDLKSKGIGLYASWLGDKGHYLDIAVRGSKLSNEYKHYDSSDQLFAENYGTWAYGAGLRYGYQQELPGGWMVEPQAGLTYGTLQSASYTAGNMMRYNQHEMNTLVGRLGVTVGRGFGDGDKRGLFYARAAVNHDFQDGGTASADALWYSYEAGQNLVGSTKAVDTLAGKDTWYDFALGANFRTGQDQTAFVELNKTAGGKVNTDWQVNAGMSWRFNGPSAKERKPDLDSKLTALTAAPAAEAGTQAQPVAPEAAAAASAPNPAAGADSAGTTALAAAAPAASSLSTGQAGQADQTAPAEQAAASEAAGAEPIHTGPAGSDALAAAGSGEPGSYTLAPLVVEASRPEWEKKLSPGTVSVIHVPEYKGEMKNLPDLLQTVPGVYVQQLSGTGHYTVARVRGSTGGQVHIYVDGVLVNSSADAAVDLSTIPIENVERVEVYRGYVPARFAGSPIGGAINIVTKKPQDTKGSVSAGMRSFGGYTGSLELTAPVGSGSLLFAFNRDQSDGDFRYTNYKLGNSDPVTQDRHRLYNDYKNTDALLKWQDDNWFAKLTYKKNITSFPESTDQALADVPTEEVLRDIFPWLPSNQQATWNRYRSRQLETTKTEFLLGRRQTAGDLEWGWKLDTSYQLKQAESSQYKNWSYGPPAQIDTEFRNRRYGGAIDGSWKVWDNHLVEFLFNYSRENMHVTPVAYASWPPHVNSVGGFGNLDKYFKTDYNTDNYYFQVQDTMTLNRSGNLFFTPVLRAQKMAMDVDLGDPDLDRWKYSYGLALKKVQNEHWTFRGSYGTYYKYPNWYEIYGDGINVKSRWESFRDLYSDWLTNSFVERGTSWDVSANWQGKALQADSDITLTYFNRRSKNLSSYALDFYGFGYYTNAAAGEIQGLELESKLNWDRWDLLLAATWNDSLITKSGRANMVTPSNVQQGHPFPWMPEWEYNVRLGYRFPGDKLTAFAEYHYLSEIGQWAGAGGRYMYEPLGLTNIGFKYDLNKQVKLTAGVNDLFNRGPNQIWRQDIEEINQHTRGNVQYPQQGRTYYMTVQRFF